MNGSAPPVFAGGPQGWWAGGGAGLPVLLPVLLGGLGLASSLGNLLLLAALAQQLRRGRLSPGHALLLNLAASDLVLALACLPTRIATYGRRSWALGGVLCRTADWLLQGCLVAKSLTWAAVAQALDRQLASPTAPQGRGGGGKRLAGLLGSAWTAALLLPLPHLLFARLEGSGLPGGLLRCLFRPPPEASGFLAVFSKLYPLAACLAPASFAAACYWRARRRWRGRRRLREAQKNRLAKLGRPPRPGAAGLLWGLTLLFHATWLPLWVAWLWERHRAMGGGAPPPPDLVFGAEGLLFLDAALSPALLLGLSPEVRDGLESLRRALRSRQEEGEGEEGEEEAAVAAAGVSGESLGTKPGERPQALAELPREAAGRVLPDLEHFWKDRRDATTAEESDPVPWGHQSGP